MDTRQKSELAADASIRDAREITHKFCGYACAHLRHRHATRRSASVFRVRPKNSLPRIVLQKDDSTLGPVSALTLSFLQIRSRLRPPCRSANSSPCRASRGLTPPSRCALQRRSEERRVGKECRSRWSPYP